MDLVSLLLSRCMFPLFLCKQIRFCFNYIFIGGFSNLIGVIGVLRFKMHASCGRVCLKIWSFPRVLYHVLSLYARLVFLYAWLYYWLHFSISASPIRSMTTQYDSYEADIAGMEAYEVMSGGNLEKSLTNLNVHIALINEQREELDRTMKEFCANFTKQQEILGKETKQLRIEMVKLRKATNRSV